MKRKLFFVAFACAASALASADLVTNGGFETPTPDNSWNYGNPDGSYVFDTSTLGGWTLGYGTAGIWRPNLGANTFGSLPGGLQAGWTSDDGNYSMMYQVLSGYTIQNNDPLNVSGYIGNRADLGSAYGLGGTGWMALYLTSGLLLAATGDVTATPGTFQYADMTYDPGSNSSFVGQQVILEIGNAYGSQASFDNVSASSRGSSVPGPAAAVPFIGVALAALKRRRF